MTDGENFSGEASAKDFDPIISLADLEETLPVPILRAEAHLIALVKREPGHPVKYYLNKSTLSTRWFYKVLGTLIEAGLIRERGNPADQRQKMLD